MIYTEWESVCEGERGRARGSKMKKDLIHTESYKDFMQWSRSTIVCCYGCNVPMCNGAVCCCNETMPITAFYPKMNILFNSQLHCIYSVIFHLHSCQLLMHTNTHTHTRLQSLSTVAACLNSSDSEYNNWETKSYTLRTLTHLVFRYDICRIQSSVVRQRLIRNLQTHKIFAVFAGCRLSVYI